MSWMTGTWPFTASGPQLHGLQRAAATDLTNETRQDQLLPAVPVDSVPAEAGYDFAELSIVTFEHHGPAER